jgi:cell division protein FtsB
MTESDINNTRTTANKKEAPVFLIFITVILTLGLAFLVYSFFGQKKRMAEMEIVLTHEKDSLKGELIKMVHSYDTMRTNNDSLNAHLFREKERIKKVLAINASNVQLVKKYRSEITTMREIMKSYIVQIDSLNTRNKVLVAENQDIKEQITKVKENNVELTKVKEDLNSKVEIASVIQAKDVAAVALNISRKETTRIDRIEKLKVCFTLRENPIAAAGKKTIYLRITRPDSLIITSSPDNLFDFNGSKAIYTSSREVDYMNQDVDICIFVDNTGDFIIGNYRADLYVDGSKIGGCTFIITKR